MLPGPAPTGAIRSMAGISAAPPTSPHADGRRSSAARTRRSSGKIAAWKRRPVHPRYHRRHREHHRSSSHRRVPRRPPARAPQGSASTPAESDARRVYAGAAAFNRTLRSVNLMPPSTAFPLATPHSPPFPRLHPGTIRSRSRASESRDSRGYSACLISIRLTRRAKPGYRTRRTSRHEPHGALPNSAKALIHAVYYLHRRLHRGLHLPCFRTTTTFASGHGPRASSLNSPDRRPSSVLSRTSLVGGPSSPRRSSF